jgi:hypothetical protein
MELEICLAPAPIAYQTSGPLRNDCVNIGSLTLTVFPLSKKPFLLRLYGDDQDACAFLMK